MYLDSWRYGHHHVSVVLVFLLLSLTSMTFWIDDDDDDDDDSHRTTAQWWLCTIVNLWSYKGGKRQSTYTQLVAFSCLVSWQTENFFLMAAAVGVRQNFALVLKTIDISNIICYTSTYVRRAMRGEKWIHLTQQLDRPAVLIRTCYVSAVCCLLCGQYF